MTKFVDHITGFLLYLVLLLSVFYFSAFNKREMLSFVCLIAFLCYFMIRSRGRLDLKMGSLVITVLYIVVFQSMDTANTPAFLDVPAGKGGTIPMATFVLVLAFLSFLVRSLMRGTLRLYTGPFLKSFAISCAFVALLSICFYPLLSTLYPVNFEPVLVLLNRIIKFLMLAVMVTDYVSNEVNFKRMGLGFIGALSLIVLLNFTL